MRRSCLAFSLLAAAALGLTAARADERQPFNGLFFGLHAGYSWEGVSGVFDNQATNTSLSGLDLNGGIVGAQLSYNVQSGWFLVGIEGDASANTTDGSVTTATGILLTSDTSYLATIRGRIGFVIYDWLLFGTAGVGFTDLKFREITPAFNGYLRDRQTGAVYGGGVEWAFLQGVTLRGEYLHYDVGTTMGIPTGPAGFPSADAGDYVKFSDIDVARAALNISLNP